MCAGERPQDVQPPDREGPRERDGLEVLRRHVDLLGVELAGLTVLDQLGGVMERSRPVEALAESFPDEGAR